MKKILITMVLVAPFYFSAQAQQKSEQKGVKREGAHQAEYNANAQDK